MTHYPRPHVVSPSAVGMMAAQIWATLPMQEREDANGPCSNMRIYGGTETYRGRLIHAIARDAYDLALAVEEEFQAREDERKLKATA